MANALRVLNELAAAEKPLAVTELAQLLGLGASTTHRLLSTLVLHGFAMRGSSHRRYRAGPALTRLARRSILEHVRLREGGRPILERLAAHTHETTHLAVLDGSDAIGIDHVESSQTVIARHPVGSRVPAHATAVGQAMLAYLPEVTAAVIAAGLTAHTDDTIVDARAFEHALEQVRRRGYAFNIRQWNPEIAGVAAPIFDESGSAIASLGVTGPASRIGQLSLLHQLGALAAEAADEIRVRMARIGAPQHLGPEDEQPPISAPVYHANRGVG